MGLMKSTRVQEQTIDELMMKTRLLESENEPLQRNLDKALEDHVLTKSELEEVQASSTEELQRLREELRDIKSEMAASLGNRAAVSSDNATLMSELTSVTGEFAMKGKELEILQNMNKLLVQEVEELTNGSVSAIEKIDALERINVVLVGEIEDLRQSAAKADELRRLNAEMVKEMEELIATTEAAQFDRETLSTELEKYKVERRLVERQLKEESSKEKDDFFAKISALQGRLDNAQQRLRASTEAAELAREALSNELEVQKEERIHVERQLKEEWANEKEKLRAEMTTLQEKVGEARDNQSLVLLKDAIEELQKEKGKLLYFIETAERYVTHCYIKSEKDVVASYYLHEHCTGIGKVLWLD